MERLNRRIAIRVGIALGGAVLVASAAASIALAQPGPYFALGQILRGAQHPNEAAVATVDGVSITSGDIQFYQGLAQLNNSVTSQPIAATPKAALDAAVRVVAVSNKAIAQGIRPSDSEINAYIASNREAFTGHAGAQLDDFLAGLQQTRDQFFSSAYTRAGYARALAITKLRAKVTSGMTAQQALAQWQQFESDAVASARVVILDPAFR
jgi:hypothetical protein